MRRFIQGTLASLLLIAAPLAPAAETTLGPVAGSASAARVRYDGHRVVRVAIPDQRALRTMLALSDDMWSHGVRNGVADFRVSPEAFEALRRSGLAFEVTIDDVQRGIDAERSRLASAREQGPGGEGGIAGGGEENPWFLDFKDNAAIASYISQLVALRPDLCTQSVIGTSLEGRPIRALRIASGPGKPSVLFDGCQHAREWISPMVVMYLADQLVRHADDDPTISDLLSRVEFTLVPVVNPDGYQYTWDVERLWRKNRRNNGDGSFGVDLNRNWGFQWGGEGSSGSPSSETYRGPSAFSEPETQVLRDHFVANPQIIATIDFHSFSQYTLYPWAYTASPTPDAALYATVGDAMVDAAYAVNGVVYTPGQVYTLLYPASGGSLDWTYGERGALSYTVELRDTGQFGFVLPPEQIVPTCTENLAAALVFADLASRAALVTLPQGAPAQVDAGVATAVSVQALDVLDTVASVSLRSRIGTSGAFLSAPAAAQGGGLYAATLPAAPCGALVQWYVEATTALGYVVRLPADAPSEFYEATAISQTPIYSTTFESAGGWTAGVPGDTATAGQWVLVDPNGTIAQPEDDHSPVGTRCYVTGQGSVGGAAGQADVDGGTTTLLSPALDASDPEARVSYWLWYSNNLGQNPGSDVFVAEISANNGATWTTLEQVTASATQWIARSFRVADFVAPSATLRVRFIASDLGPGSLVEAAIDDFAITAIGCADGILGDLDRDGDVDGADLGLLLGQWGSAGSGPGGADLDGDGVVGGGDLGLLLGAWG